MNEDSVPPRKRTEEILELKQRNPYDIALLSFEVDSLRTKWKKESQAAADSYADFFIIRAVTLLEVSLRSSIARLINHGAPYVRRAVSLVKDLKFDYELVSDLQGKTITLGDLVAHSIALNKAEQILSTFSVLLDKDPRISLTSVIDASYGATSTEPLIHNYDSTVRALSDLMKVRHILVHEVPRQKVYSESDLPDFLDAAYAFCYATEEVVSLEIFGKIPRTQVEMNAAAYESQKNAESNMESVLASIRLKVTERGAVLSSMYAGRDNVPEHFKQSAEEWLELLEQSQTAWTQYRDKYSEFQWYLNRTGTVYPTRISSSRGTMTTERIDQLERWLELDRRLHEG